MRTLTDEQEEMITKKPEYIELKTELLQEYKSYQENLEYADDEFEESMIEKKREKLAIQIRALGDKIREIEALEGQA